MKPAIVPATPGYWYKSSTGAYRRVVAWEIDWSVDDGAENDPDAIILAGEAYPIVISDDFPVVFNNTGSPM